MRDRLQADNDTRPESLLRLAQASFDLGDLTREIGDQQDALKAYRESLAIHQKLAEAHPTVTEYQLGLGNSYISIANVLSVDRRAGRGAQGLRVGRGDLSEAGRRERERRRFPQPVGVQPLQTRQSVVEIWAGIPTQRPRYARPWRSTRSWSTTTSPTPKTSTIWGTAIGLLAAVKFDAGELAQAEPEFRRALAIQQKLADDNPAVTNFRRALAQTHMNLSVLHDRSGKLAEAEAENRRALAIHQKLVDDNPAVSSFRDFLAWNHLNLGILLTITDKQAEAKAELSQALAIYQKLVDDNPTVTHFREGLGNSHLFLGVVMMNSGKPAEAEAEYRRALAVLQKLVDDSPTLTHSRMMLGYSHRQLGSLLMNSGRLAEAEAELRRALAIRRGLPEDNPDNQELLAYIHGNIGRCPVAGGEAHGCARGAAKGARDPPEAGRDPTCRRPVPGRDGEKPPRDRPASRPREAICRGFRGARNRRGLVPETG